MHLRSETVYEVGKIVYPDTYDHNIENVCSNGIHYFKTIEPAYFYRNPPINYTGIAICWHNNGQKYSEGPMLNGIKNGKWTYWFSDGSINQSGEYVKNRQFGRWRHSDIHGKTIFWYHNGV